MYKALQCLSSEKTYASSGGTVVDSFPDHPKVAGSSQTNASCTKRENDVKKLDLHWQTVGPKMPAIMR